MRSIETKLQIKQWVALTLFAMAGTSVIVSCSSQQQQQSQQQDPIQQNNANSQNANANVQNNALDTKKANNTNTNFVNQAPNSAPVSNYATGINNAVEASEPIANNMPTNIPTNIPSNLPPTNTSGNSLVPINSAMNTAVNSVPMNTAGTGNVMVQPNSAPVNVMVSPSNIAAGGKVIDLGPPHGMIQWVGYNFRKDERKLDVQIVTDGKPVYKVFQDVNRARQPEIVIRFLNTEIRHKIRRDMDASEFRSPVAYVRMRRDNIFRHSDVILTLRDSVQPKMIAKGSSIMLTFDIPDRWYGPQGDADIPIAKVDIAPDSNVMPVADANSEASPTTAKTVVRAYIDDPGKDEFRSTPETAAVPLVPAGASKELVPAAAAPVVPVAAPVAVVPVMPAAQPVAVAPQAVAKPVAAAPAPVKPPTPVAPVQQNISANAAPAAANANIAAPANMAAPSNNVVSPSNNAALNSAAAQNIPQAKPVRRAELAPAAAQMQAPPMQPNMPMQRQVAPQMMMPPPVARPAMMAPPVMLAPPPQVIPAPQGVPGVVPQTMPAQPAQPSEPKDPTGKGADKFQVQTKFIEQRFTVAGVAQANYAADIPAPKMGSSPLINGESENQQSPIMAPNQSVQTQMVTTRDVQPVEQSGVVSDKRLMKFDFRSATVATVLRAISNESGINFVMPPDVAARKISVSLNNVAWDVALKAVLESNRLGMEEVGPRLIRVDNLKTFIEDRDAQDRAKQATAALIPTKVMVFRLSYALADKLAPIIQDLFPKADVAGSVEQQRNYVRYKVKADIRSNSVIVEATPAELAKVRALIERLDLPTPQVRISSRIVEVIAKAENGLGISWGSPFNIDAGRGLGFGSLPFPNNLNSNFAVDPSMSGTPVGAASMRFGSINNVMALDLKIKMLESRNEAESLQSQELMVEDNQEAKIEAGSADFFSAPAQGLNGPTLTPVTYNTSLAVTPHITADGAVQMNLKIVGDVPTAPSAASAAAGKFTRSLNTTMMRRSGDTAVIGGLYTTDKSKTVNGVPYLSRLPIIGALFRSSYSIDQRRDLLIMVTPTIVNTSAGMADDVGNSGGMGPLSAGAEGIGPAPGNLSVTETMTPPANNVVGSSNAAATQQAQSQQAAPQQQGNGNSSNVAPASNNMSLD